MAKRKRESIQAKQNQKNMDVVDYAKTQSFLNSAINDISGYIIVFDTKVSIIMAALGVIISGIINCRQIIYDAYKNLQTYSLLFVFCCVLIFIFFLAIVLVYYWGLKTIKAHVCSINFKSLWFIIEKKENYSFETYKTDVEKMTEKDIIDTMAAELYKLNDIFRQKALSTKKTIGAFTASLTVLFIIVVLCIFLSVK